MIPRPFGSISRPLRRLWGNPFRRDGVAQEVEEEHAFHLDEKSRELVDRGVPPAEARRQAEADFGRRAHWRRQALRERRRGQGRLGAPEVGDGLVLDIVVAARQLLRRPAFSLAAIAVVALGVGFGVAVLTTVDAVLYRPLPYANAARVVWLRGVFSDVDGWGVSPANWLDWKGLQRSFSATAATRAVNASLMEGGADYVGTLRVESAFFQVLGVRPHQGRLLVAADDRPDAPDVAVLTHRLWVARFGGDPALLGREITLGGRRTTVVGILPPSFGYRDQGVRGGPERHIFTNDIYLGDRTSRFPGGFFWPVALLRDGITLAEAAEDMDRVAAAVAETYPDLLGASADGGPLGISVTPLRDAITQEVRGGVQLLGGFVLLLVLVVCVNAAGLLLADTVDRSRELAVRASLGANGLRLARETLAHVALLTLLGGVAGLAIAAIVLRGIHAIAPPDVAFLAGARVDGRVALGAAGLAIIIWAVAGVLPALRAGRVDPDATLRSGGWSVPPARSRAGRAIIVAQLALATALVTGAGILLSTYASMVAVEPGMRIDAVRVLRYQLPRDRYARAAGTMADYVITLPDGALAEQVRSGRASRVGSEARAFLDQAVTRLRAVPGVVGVAVANERPFSPVGYTVRAVDPDEHALQSESGGRYWLRWVSPEYFDLMGLRLLKGRALDERDAAAAEPAIVVSEAFVATYLRNDPEPVGTVVPVAEAGYFPPRRFTVVGVVADVLDRNPSQAARPAVYIPIAQRGELWSPDQVGLALRATFLVRVDPQAGPSERALREAISELDPTLVIEDSTTLAALYAELTRETRFWLALLAAFGVVALLLAATGTSALLAQAVRHRTREIAVRRALGASAGVVLAGVVKDAVKLAASGLILGLTASWYLSRLLAAHVVGVEGIEIVPVAGVVGVLLAAAAAAAWTPARWACRVDPAEALRIE